MLLVIILSVIFISLYFTVRDIDSLLKGQDYTELKDSNILFICKTDPFKDDDVSVDVDMFYEVDRELVIERPEDTWNDRNIVFGVVAKEPGFYEIEMIGSSDLNSLAQIPMQLYMSSIPCAVVTWNGSEGKDVSVKTEILLFSRNGVMRAHFSGAGVKLKKMIIRYSRPFDEGAAL